MIFKLIAIILVRIIGYDFQTMHVWVGGGGLQYICLPVQECT